MWRDWELFKKRPVTVNCSRYIFSFQIIERIRHARREYIVAIPSNRNIKRKKKTQIHDISSISSTEFFSIKRERKKVDQRNRSNFPSSMMEKERGEKKNGSRTLERLLLDRFISLR